MDRIRGKNNEQSAQELYRKAGQAGWIREVVTGDRRGNATDRMRVTYLPPKRLRHIKNRLYKKTDLQEFLTTHCTDTNLSVENFSFSNHVLGLGMACEIVRPATIRLDLAQEMMATHQLQQPEPVTRRNRSRSVPPRSPPVEDRAVDLPKQDTAADVDDGDLGPVPPPVRRFRDHQEDNLSKSGSAEGGWSGLVSLGSLAQFGTSVFHEEELMDVEEERISHISE